MVARTRDFIVEHRDCFERSLTIGHLTGSAWIVDPQGTHALLMHHRKLDRWLQCGGHADGESNMLGVALREALEESGLPELTIASRAIYDVDVHEIPERPGEPAHEHFDVRYIFFGDLRHRPIVSRESNDVAWVSLAQLDRYGADDSVRRMAAKTRPFLARSNGDGRSS